MVLLGLSVGLSEYLKWEKNWFHHSMQMSVLMDLLTEN